MNMPASYIPRSQLPKNIEKHTNALRRRKRRIPKWMTDEPTRTRTFGVYRDYLQHATLPELVATYLVSVSQIYRDIDNAREAARWETEQELEELVADAVGARQQVIRQAYETLRNLQRSVSVSASRAKVEGEILALIGSQQTALETIQQLRGHRGPLPEQGGEVPLDGFPSGQGLTLIINAAGSQLQRRDSEKAPVVLDVTESVEDQEPALSGAED